MPEPQSCQSCEAIAGRISLTNVPRIYEGRHWIVEHVHPTNILGWLVIVARQHRSAIHELTVEEHRAFGLLLPAVCRALHDTLGTQKEYVLQIAEKPGFNHVHYHVIARRPDWPDDWVAFGCFDQMGDHLPSPLSTEAIQPTTERIGTILKGGNSLAEENNQ